MIGIEVRKKRIRWLLWTYFLLIIFEGALRKWFLPFLSTPLLVARDPLAILSIFWAWPLLTKSIYWTRITLLIYIGIVSMVLTLYVGHGDWLTGLYGLRIYGIHLPLIFVYPIVFTKKDVIQICWTILGLSIPMVILLAAQSTSPPSHILNIGPGGTGTTVFSGAGDKFRPSAAFSFTNSVTLFFTLSAAAFMSIIYGTSKRQKAATKVKEVKKRWLTLMNPIILTLSGFSLIIALPVSISRGLMACYATVLLYTISILALTRTNIGSLIIGIGITIMASNLALNIPLVKEASAAFALRWELAGGDAGKDKGNVGIVESQLKGRVLSGYLEPIRHIDEFPILGRGIGFGSNIGAVRMSGKKQFLSHEGSWAKTMDEKGIFIGAAFIIWRISTTMMMAKKAIVAGMKHNNKVPIILASASIQLILAGQLGQSSGLGFVVLTTGLTFASMKETKVFNTEDENKFVENNKINRS